MEEHREKPCTNELESERRSTDPETKAAEADDPQQNLPDQHSSSTTTPAPKAPEPQLNYLPSGWEIGQTEDGRTYFIDHNTKTNTWSDPRNHAAGISTVGLPNGWEIRQTKSERTYFVDHSTRTTTWEDPRSPNAQAQENPVPKSDELPSGVGSGETQNGGPLLDGPDSLNRPVVSSPLRAKL